MPRREERVIKITGVTAEGRKGKYECHVRDTYFAWLLFFYRFLRSYYFLPYLI